MITKKTYRVFYVLGAIILLAACTTIISLIYIHFKKSNDEIPFNTLSQNEFSLHNPTITWIDGHEEIKGDSILKEQIIHDYTLAWAVLNEFLRSGDTSFISNFYSSALANDLKKTNLISDRVDLSHQLVFHFLSLDKKTVSFTDGRIDIVEKNAIGKGRYNAYTQAFHIVMMLHDGKWKIQQSTPTRPIEGTTSMPGILLDTIKDFDKEVDLMTCKGINYYPADYPWTMFWDSLDLDQTAIDFSLIQSLGLNTIRIFIPYENKYSIRENNDLLQRINDVLKIADQFKLQLIITPFDFPKGYAIQDLPEMTRYMQSLIQIGKSHHNLLAWDLKNEPDLDFEDYSQEAVISWLDYMIALVRKESPRQMITIGWANAKYAHILAPKLDFISFHYYKDPDDFRGEIESIKRKVQIEKPIVVEEFGMSTWNSYLFPGGHSQYDQYIYFKEIIEQCERLNVPFLFWTLYDFKRIPSQVTGNLPWRKTPQKYYGIVDEAGHEKLGFKFFTDSMVKIPFLNWLKPFHITFISSLLSLIILIALVRRYIWI